MQATIVLGMHRSGTSCLAGMLVAAGYRPPGAVVRNWDNRHGHHEAIAAIRLNEAVLAHSGGHWLQPPPSVRWTAEQAQARDALLIPGAVIKDPRCLLTLPFWMQARPRCLGIVRHPVAVAHSLGAWRGMPGNEALALWLAHNRPLIEAGVPILDFDQPPETFCLQVADLLGCAITPLLAAYDRTQVHHDGGDTEGLDPGLLEQCRSLHQRLLGGRQPLDPRHGYPWAQVQALRQHLTAGDHAAAELAAWAALEAAPDAGAVLVPAVAAFLRVHDEATALRLIEAARPVAEAALCELLAGKAHLAAGRAEAAIAALMRSPTYWEARHLLAHALRRAGRTTEAAQHLTTLLPEALHPYRLHSELAEWAHADGLSDAALTHLAEAIAAAPPHRRGRLRTRRAALLRQAGRTTEADAELAAIPDEDPGWCRH